MKERTAMILAVVENCVITVCMTVGIITTNSLWWLLMILLMNSWGRRKPGEEERDGE